MSKVDELKPVFVRHIPQPVEEGILYISEDFHASIHLCACGCGQQTVLPFNMSHGWNMVKEDGDLITFSPSIGNFNPPPYHAHYFIRRNKIVWC